MIAYKLITNHCFLTIPQRNKTDTEKQKLTNLKLL